MTREDRLRELKRLYENGLLTESLYEEQQRTVLSEGLGAQITHLEQYKMLRDEIMYHTRGMDALKTTGAAAAAAIYSWLLLHPGEARAAPEIWYLPPAVLVYCGVEFLERYRRIAASAEYLSLLERDAFDDDPLAGWERFKTGRGLRLYDRLLTAVASLLYFCGTVAAVYFSWRRS